MELSAYRLGRSSQSCNAQAGYLFCLFFSLETGPKQCTARQFAPAGCLFASNRLGTGGRQWGSTIFRSRSVCSSISSFRVPPWNEGRPTGATGCPRFLLFMGRSCAAWHVRRFTTAADDDFSFHLDTRGTCSGRPRRPPALGPASHGSCPSKSRRHRSKRSPSRFRGASSEADRRHTGGVALTPDLNPDPINHGLRGFHRCLGPVTPPITNHRSLITSPL